jgi:anti-sigma-K factor RskA
MNPANHIPQDDLALFALQFLPEQEMADALTHLQHCEACRTEVAKYQGDLAAYAMTSEMHSPPALARERLLRRVAKEKKVVPVARPVPVAVPDTEPVLAPRTRVFEIDSYEDTGRRQASPFLTWAGWAVAAGVTVVAGLQFHQRQMLQAAFDSESAKVSQASADASKAEEALTTLTSQGAMQVALHIPPPEGVPVVHTPEGHVAYMSDKGALVFVGNNLLPLPQYKTYELWLIPPEGSGKVPEPAGTFKPDERGNASVVMPTIPKGFAASAFGVTIEDEGGSKTPTMPIVLAGM